MVDCGGRQRPTKPTAINTATCTRRRSSTAPLLPVAHPGEPVFLAAEQLAGVWCVSVMSVYRQVHDDRLPAIRIGDPDKGRLVIPAHAIHPDPPAPSPDAVPAVSARPFHRLAATARFLGVSYGNLHREVHAGHFPGVRVRSVWLVPAAAIDAMITAALECNGLVLARDFGDWISTPTPNPPAIDGAIGRQRPAVS